MISKLDKYKYAQFSQSEINNRFVTACSDGDLELVKYFLLDEKIINAEISCNSNAGIRYACQKKHNDVVMFLLDGKELKQKVSINVHDGALLLIALQTQNIELVDCFLTRKNNKRISLEKNGAKYFAWLMNDFNKNKEIIRRLIVDYDLERDQKIIDFLDEKNRGIEEKRLVNEWFEKREFAKTMQYVFEEEDKDFVKVKPKRNKI